MMGNLILLCLCFFSSITQAEDAAIGKIKTLSGLVSIDRSGNKSTPETGSPVYQKDRIITGQDGKVGLLFNDDSRISLGPNSNMGLENFNFDPASQNGAMNVGVKHGTLSVIAGKMVEKTPGSLKVKTPTAILAVRGTEFSLKVDEASNQEVLDHAKGD